MLERSRWGALVDQLRASGDIGTAAVEAAFRAVPRTWFLPGVDEATACSDVPVPVKQVGPITLSGSSAPSMMAAMLEQLDVRPGHRVLEIGAGTGYNAALLAELAGPRGSVVTIDVDEDITARATAALGAFGYGRVRVVTGDGALGFADGATYDRIVSTVGCFDIAPAWIAQLAPGGVLMAPLWLRGVEVLAMLRREGDHLASDTLSPCMFQRLRGAHAGPEGPVPLADGTDLAIWLDDRSTARPESVFGVLRAAHRDLPGTTAIDESALRHLLFWLALRRHDLCLLTLYGGRDAGVAVPWVSRGAFRFAAGLLGGRGACVLGLPDADAEPHARPAFVRTFGDAAHLGQALLHELSSWDSAGRPVTEGYRLRVYPSGSVKPAPAPDRVAVSKPNSVIVVERRA